MKWQIKNLEEEKSKLQEELQIAQACEYLIFCLDIVLPMVIIEISFYQVLSVTILDL
jgi:hypothetical protein